MTTQLEDAIAALPEGTIKYEATFIPQSKSRNAKKPAKGDKIARTDLSLNWTLTINGETFDYTAGVGHISNDEIRRAAMKDGWTVNEDESIRSWCEGKWLSLKGSAIGPIAFGMMAEPNHKQTPPSLADVLYAVLSDSGALDETFEEWASNFGYDTDSRSAEKIYNQCREGGLKLIRAIGAELREKFRGLEH